MEKENLIKRMRERKGQSFTEVKITAKGRELCGLGVQRYKSLIQSLSSHLSAEEREYLHEHAHITATEDV